MFKKLSNIIFLVVLVGIISWAYSIIPQVKKEIIPEGLTLCSTDSDCVVFGETEDCNCGCYNKNYLPSRVKGDCSCSVPVSCKCFENKCKNMSKEISNFNDCVNSGYTVLESYPRQCHTSDATFTEDFCVKKDTGHILTLSDAKKIAINSECGNNLKKTFVCNETTGTYWVDLNLEKKGCNPACVVSIESKTARINWRCTGLVQ